VLGQVILKPVRPKNVSAQTLQETKPIETYKGYIATDVYLIGLGAGRDFSESSQAQKCFSPNPSAIDTNRKI
jgi:hypothetical protein